MPYFLVADFRGGLDTRKSPWTAEAGTLQTFVNGHVTRGGEIEKRKEFTDVGDLLASTHALIAASPGGAARGLTVFGSAAAPSLPAGVTYQRLQHPDGTPQMTGVDAMTLFDGRPYVVARFDDDSQWHFYDGELVTDWGAGVVRSAMVSTDDIAEHLRSLIDASDEYTATRIGNEITVVGPLGVEYETDSETENVTGGVDDQTITIVELEEPIDSVENTPAMAEFAILNGSDDAGVANYIDAVRVDVGGVFTDLISAPVPFRTSPELTAYDVITEINAGALTHGYAAATRYGRVFIYAPTADADTANGRILEATAKGDVILYNGSFAINAGTAGAGNEVTEVKVNGVAVTSAPVPYNTSNSQTAADIAADIRTFASSPKMNAIATGATVFISPEKIRSDDPATFVLEVTTGGDVGAGDGDPPPPENDYEDYENYMPPTGRPGGVEEP
jgi:hypothetical protein